MSIFGKLIIKGIILRESLEQQYTNPIELNKNELRNVITPHLMIRTNRGIGILLIFVGIRLFYYVLEIKSMI